MLLNFITFFNFTNSSINCLMKITFIENVDKQILIPVQQECPDIIRVNFINFFERRI